MKRIRFRKKNNPKERTKRIVISQRSEDEECFSVVRKSFLYRISTTNKIKPTCEAPQIYIKKSFNTKRAIEKFSFRVQGHFFMNHKRMLLRVDFHHILNMQLRWKTKIFSPKKSEILA